MKKFYHLLIMALFAVGLHAQTTVVDIVVNSDQHNTLEAALGAAGLVETLQGDGPFTVFAPTDAAFAALPAGTVDALLADPMGQLTNILLNHVVGASVKSTDLSNGQLAMTLNGSELLVTINDNGVFINNAQVTMADIETDNGVVHVIDAVMLPRTTVADIVIGSDNHNTLEAALGAAGLVETLKGAGPFTVFAPTDAAFAALPAGTVDALLADPMGQLANILLNHVVGASVKSTDLSNGQLAMTLNGSELLVTINDNGVFINNAQVTMADIETDNGVVHVIDAVMLPRTTVADIVIGSDNHNTLEAALGAAGLVETLKGAGPFTVFAPTDAAFAALPEGTVDALLADPMGQLTDILLYHVVSGTAKSTDLSNGQNVVTINGTEIIVSINDNGVFINQAQVTLADIETDNGVVHVIDAVITPDYVGTEDLSWLQDVRLYPNPAIEVLQLDLSAMELLPESLSIINAVGSKVYNQKISNKFESIDISPLNSGVYLLQINVDDKIYTKQFVVR